MSNESSNERHPLNPPRDFDPDWQTKIERAREAREQGLRARAGKPASFRHAVGRA